MRFMTCFAVAATLAASSAHAEGPGAVSDLAPFRAVELRHDGVVEIRHGAVQQVTLVAGDRWPGSFTVADGRLMINGCKGCGKGFHVVVVTPSIDALTASGEGGRITVDPGFAGQAHAALKADGGGVVQAANLQAEAVVAVASKAGRIETGRTRSLVAKADDGEVVYGGQPRIISTTAGAGKVRPAD